MIRRRLLLVLVLLALASVAHADCVTTFISYGRYGEKTIICTTCCFSETSCSTSCW